MEIKNTILVIAALLIAAIFVAGCSQQYGQNAPAQTPPTTTATNGNQAGQTIQPTSVDVEIRNFAFSPATITIKKGDTITWTNYDSAPHTATSSGNFDSGTLNQGQSWSNTFNTAGTFDYICTIHPHMKGKVIVTE